MAEKEERVTDSGAEVVRQVRNIVRDLMPHRARIYWADFLVSWSLAMSGIALALFQPMPLRIIGSFVGGLALYRVSVFTHEISHMTKGQFRGFRVTWNVLFGIPALMPSFLYGDHASHHVNHSYGTEKDGEYYPLARGPFYVVVFYFAHIFLLPLGAIMRFAVLAPVSLLFPPLREIVWQRCSFLVVINPLYRRPPVRSDQRMSVAAQEIGACVWCWSIAACFFMNLIPLSWVAIMYAIFVVGATLNYYRAFGAHLYVNQGEPMTYLEQLLDSTTVEGIPVVTELAAPLGMRYHALHHLVPTLPYHAMKQAHERLMRELPDDSPYRETIRPSITAVVVEVSRNAWAGGQSNHVSIPTA